MCNAMTEVRFFGQAVGEVPPLKGDYDLLPLFFRLLGEVGEVPPLKGDYDGGGRVPLARITVSERCPRSKGITTHQPRRSHPRTLVGEVPPLKGDYDSIGHLVEDLNRVGEVPPLKGDYDLC